MNKYFALAIIDDMCHRLWVNDEQVLKYLEVDPTAIIINLTTNQQAFNINGQLLFGFIPEYEYQPLFDNAIKHAEMRRPYER